MTVVEQLVSLYVLVGKKFQEEKFTLTEEQAALLKNLSTEGALTVDFIVTPEAAVSFSSLLDRKFIFVEGNYAELTRVGGAVLSTYA